MKRPTLIPGLPRAWRGPTELQLGSGPTRAVLLRLAHPRTAQLLDLLDGSRSEGAVLTEAAERGIPPDQAREVIETLRLAGLAMPATALLPAHDALLGEAAAMALHGVTAPAAVLRRRATARVLLTGHGRLGASIAVALAESGIGHVQPDLPGVVTRGELPAGPLRGIDIGQARRDAILAAIRLRASGAVPFSVRRGPATLVVQLDHDEPAALVAAAHAQRRQPHLAVTVREGVPVVGPLVPGAGAPCLACLELHRKDRDAGWPGPSRSSRLEPCAATALLAATAFATAEVLAFVDGGSPETLGTSVEVSAPGRLRRRTWTPHPKCVCLRRVVRPRRRPPAGEPPRGQETGPDDGPATQSESEPRDPSGRSGQ